MLQIIVKDIFSYACINLVKGDIYAQYFTYHKSLIIEQLNLAKN